MKVYSYNPITKEFICETECQIDQLESKKQKKKIFLLPAGATLIKPPESEKNKIAILENKEWIIKDDLRGNIYYDKTLKTKNIITDIDQHPLVNWTDIEPLSFDDSCMWINNKWEIDQIKLIEIEKEKEKEIIIQEKIREQAIIALQDDGILNEKQELI